MGPLPQSSVNRHAKRTKDLLSACKRDPFRCGLCEAVLLLCSADGGFAPLDGLTLHPETELYLGLVHRDDMAGNAARLAAARRHVRVDGVATECGMARGDPERFPALLAAHVQTAELPATVT